MIGEVAGRTALIVDDFVTSGGTVVQTADVLAARGAKRIYAAISHGVFAPDAIQRIDDSPIAELLVTDSVEFPHERRAEKIVTVSVAPGLGRSGLTIVDAIVIGPAGSGGR